MPEAIEKRKLAAIMFTDKVGYSALSQRDGRFSFLPPKSCAGQPQSNLC